MNRGDGLEEIGHGEFLECTSLCEISIPPSTEAIKQIAIDNCEFGRGTRGDWQGGVRQMHIASAPCHTLLCRKKSQEGKFDECGVLQ